MKVYGSGHVVAYNYIANFHDGVDHATYGNPDGSPNAIRDRLPVSIDFYNNDITNVDDNCIEADGAAHNVRIFRNRCFNHGHRALSAQPVFGGPVYFIRNLVYHAPEGGALKTSSTPAGLVVYHNTLLAPVRWMIGAISNLHFRNNLILGRSEAPELFTVDTFTNYSTSDYNGFRPNEDAEFSFQWNSPPVRDPRRLRREAGEPDVQDAGGVQRRHRAGPAQRSGGLRRVSEGLGPGSIRSAHALQAGRLRFSPAARIEGGRCRDSSSERQRRFGRAGARSRSLRERVSRCRTMDRDDGRSDRMSRSRRLKADPTTISAVGQAFRTAVVSADLHVVRPLKTVRLQTTKPRFSSTFRISDVTVTRGRR